ncbi:MAG TPA: hypothetical protein VFH82_13520 [Gemmatimonadota bacterium]|nr:hypothetical protein [Gemmatimonadota bacterium]
MRGESFHRLRQTRAFRIVGVYTATAWGIFEILDKTVRTFGWSEVIPRTSLVLLIVGLVVVTFTAWAYAGQEVGESTGWRWPGRIQALLANRWFGRVAIAGLGVALLLWGWRMVRPDVRYAPFSIPELRATSQAPRVAVLPVSSSDPRLEQHRRTLLRLLSTDLNDVADMRTIRSDLVASRWEEGTRIEPKTIAGFGRESGVHFVVVPEVERGGEGLRVSAEVLETGRGESIGHAVVEGREGDLDRLSDRLSMQLYRTLVADEGDELLTSPVRARTSSMHAYKAFLRGERAFRRADFDGALSEYGRATAADSSFALAWFRQGLVRRWEDPAVGPPIESFDNVTPSSDNLSADDREMWRASGALEWGMLESVPSLAAVVTRRPADAQAWYLLADAESWAGEQLLLTPDSVASTIDHAIRSDPGFVPSRLMRIPIALLRGADRPALESMIDSMAAADADTEVVAAQRVLVEVAFGSPEEAALEGLPVHVLWWLADALAAPHLLDRQAVVLQEIRRRADRADPRPAKRMLYYNLLARGLQADALEVLDDPGMNAFLPEAAYRTIQRGMGLPPQLVIAATDVYDPDGTATTWFYGGAMAVDQGRWQDVTYAVDRLFEESQIIGQNGDAFLAREHSMVGGVLDQYARIRSGAHASRERVAELEARRSPGLGATEFARIADATARWWLAELWLELGDRERAVEYFRSLWGDPAAVERLRALEAG